MNLDSFLIDMVTDDVTVSGEELRKVAQLLEDAMASLKHKNEVIREQDKCIKKLQNKISALEFKEPLKVELGSLIRAYA